MSIKYKNLLSPIKVGNNVFKNRLVVPTNNPYFVQGSEPYPTEAAIIHYANKAKNGAALVTCHKPFHQVPVKTEKNFVFEGRGYAKHRVATRSDEGSPFADNMESYLAQAVEAIHFYGAKASIWTGVDVPPQYDVSAGFPLLGPAGAGSTVPGVSEEIPTAMLEKIADEFALQAAFMKDQGFDMVTLHMSYRAMLLGRFLSPLTNQRTDQYGGSGD
jgi:2,4-dienoyl-CoA reductase-like NADH-dependent reductase (Old Yellow Enzyme family)